MTSLHEGHKAEERIKCIDDMLVKCEDTKFTVLQAFWWYRKYTKDKLQKLEKIERIINEKGNIWSASVDERLKEILKQE